MSVICSTTCPKFAPASNTNMEPPSSLAAVGAVLGVIAQP
jgi:hypothetical protein